MLMTALLPIAAFRVDWTQVGRELNQAVWYFLVLSEIGMVAGLVISA
jgi:hypothetical protein